MSRAYGPSNLLESTHWFYVPNNDVIFANGFE